MVQLITAATILALAMSAAARPSPALPDPAGVPHLGNQNHEQFIGGQCINSLDCATTACCATLGSIGVCSGLGAQTQAGKTGCGFGDGGAAPPASSSPSTAPATDAGSSSSGSGSSSSGSSSSGSGSGSSDSGSGSGSSDSSSSSSSGSANTGVVTINPNAAGSQFVGQKNGQQFITGQCTSDADCASGCCATGGACAARAVVEGPGSTKQCGFVGTLQ
ncbi:hypothetical protein F5Y19DRAFT_343318 [Xylariaceae sp. FL1651]|nr:hypothetical protein F5Y19DRAFT_343318 [Xylariaceae sp. FL1651]